MFTDFPYLGGISALSSLSVLHGQTCQPHQTKLALFSFAQWKFVVKMHCNRSNNYCIEIPFSPLLSCVFWGRSLLLFGFYFGVWFKGQKKSCMCVRVHLLPFKSNPY